MVRKLALSKFSVGNAIDKDILPEDLLHDAVATATGSRHEAMVWREESSTWLGTPGGTVR